MDRKETNADVRRLDSWKEIAAFFGRDERTVKRWEKERGLPVHRLPGEARSPVFAYAEELAQWSDRGTPRETPAASAPETGAQSPPPESTAARGVAPQRKTKISLWVALTAIVIVCAGLIRWREPRKPFAHVPPPEAEQLYLKGRYYWSRRTPENLNKAVDAFTQSIVKDPAYAQAYAGLADVYNLLSEYGSMPYQEAFTRAIAASRRALELDGRLAGAHCSLAFASFYGAWDRQTAEREFRRAIQLDPQYVTAHHWFATALMTMGRPREAIVEIERAQQLDPASTSILADKGVILWWADRKSEAVALLKQIAASEPAFVSTHHYLAIIYLYDKDYRNFVVEAQTWAGLAGDAASASVAAAAAKGLATGGPTTMFTSMLEAQEKLAGSVTAYSVAVNCASLHDDARTLSYLRRAIDNREIYALTLPIDPIFDRLRGNPEFLSLVNRVEHPQT